MAKCTHCKDKALRRKGETYHRIKIADREYVLATICSCGCNNPEIQT